MLKYHIINLASCRLCPRRAAGGKERRYMDQNDKNKSNKNNDRRRGVLSLLIWALVLTIGFVSGMYVANESMMSASRSGVTMAGSYFTRAALL